MTDASRTPQRDLRADNRGAVMVIGVFMAAFLVGSLWYIIGFGDALLYRERMQDGADAVAFAAAVYHARGMNIIAMLNLIMAAILAVLVALKIAHLLLMITKIISCAIAACLPWGAWAIPICTASTTADSYVQTAINFMEKFCDTVLPALSKTQKVVAITMPWIAEARAVMVSQNYKKPVEGGVILSSSLVPSGDRLGLPVQEDTFKELCRRAGMIVGEVVMAPFSAFGVSTQWASGLLGGLVSSFPGYFCGDSGGSSGGSGMNNGTNYSNDAAYKICTAKKQAWDDQYKGKKPFNMGECMKQEKKNTNQQMGGSPGGSKMSGDSSNKTPKKVFESAKNGNDYFQIWSVVWGDQSRMKEGEKGVGIAAWNKAKIKDPAIWTKVGFAQAEFYYDGAGSWDDLNQDSMWNMRWRARLRRVRPPSQASGALSVVSAIVGMCGELGISDPSDVIDGSMLGSGGWGSLFDGSAWGNILQSIPDGMGNVFTPLPSGYEPVPGFWGAEVIH
jgi:hypothetical protein